MRGVPVPTISSAGYDAGGYLVAFVVCACFAVGFTIAYRMELRGRRRPYYLFRFRAGIAGTLMLTILAGLRRFVFHQ